MNHMSDPASSALLTVDELARRVGMTVRNVRAHQSRGLLPPPVVEGRTGFYSAEHVARLELVKDMQAEGYNLKAIQHTLERVPRGAEQEVLAFRRSLLEPWSPEEPETVDLSGVAELLGVDVAAVGALVSDAVRLGLLEPLGDDRYAVPSPALLRAGGEAVALGIPVEAVLTLERGLRRQADAVASAFVELFLAHVWRPFAVAGQPEEEWPRVRQTLDRLQPLAAQALLATFHLSMSRAVEAAVGAELAR
jgi:DNA-binding transcriptional MerR regulator